MPNIITPNPIRTPFSGLSVQQLKQSQKFDSEYNAIFLLSEGTLTEAYGFDVNSIFLVANSKLKPNEIQQEILNSFQETFSYIEKNIDPTRLNFNITKAIDDEICINRIATSGGRVKLIINDDGVIALSFLPNKSNLKGSELYFHSVDDNIDFEKLSYAFFSF